MPPAPAGTAAAGAGRATGAGRRWASAAVAAVLIFGMTASATSPGRQAVAGGGAVSGQPAAGAAWQRAEFATASPPQRVRVPAIGVDAPIESVGLASDGTVETPPLDQPRLTGWYRYGPTPGQRGPAVILGHVDTATTGPAVFYRLRELKANDRITIRRADGSEAEFSVVRLQKVAKNAFPSRQVYGDISFAGLRLVTCGGSFDSSAGSYDDNVIAYAKLLRTKTI